MFYKWKGNNADSKSLSVFLLLSSAVLTTIHHWFYLLLITFANRDISMSTGLKIVCSRIFHSWNKGSSTSPTPEADNYFTWSIPCPLYDRFWMLQHYGLCIYLRVSRGGTWWLRADTWAWLWPSQRGFKCLETQKKKEKKKKGKKRTKLGGICFVAKLLHWKKDQAVVRWCFLGNSGIPSCDC